MLTAAQLLTTLGDDTVELVIRDKDTATPDQWGRPTLTDRAIAKAGCSWQVTGGTEDLGGAIIATLEARGMLPVDADTEGLDSTAAVRHDGRLFELTTPGVTMRDGFGRVSHVRVYARWADNVSLGEQVTAIAAGRRHDGIIDPDGPPVQLIARGVAVGDARIQFGGTGPTIAADYTVVLDLDAPVRDGDWLIVRGRECRVMVGRQESQWAERRQLVVLAKYRGGGVT